MNLKTQMRKELLLFLAAAALLAACGGGEPTPTPVPTEVGALPICAAAGLLAPVLISPADNEIGPVYGEEVITQVQYPDPACQPESFEKFISPNPSFDGDNFIINPSPVNILNAPAGLNGSGQLTTALADCTQYFWKARAIVGATAGPFSPIHTFYTNYGGACPVPAQLKPICASADILAPQLVSPLDGEINPAYGEEVITEIHYPDASCSPEYFEKFVTDDPNFISDTNFIVNPGPVNILNPVGQFSGSGQITMPLPDCTQYYFRARAVVGGVQGPYSEIRTFFIDINGSCNNLPAYFAPEPEAMPAQNANCRFGPSATAFEVYDTLYAGTAYKPLGQGPDHLWLLFKAPASSGNCWVYINNLQLSCRGADVDMNDLGSCKLPFVDYPLIPTLTPTATFTPEPAAPFVPECRDGKDNDRDGRSDFPSDTSCMNANDNDESN